MCCTGGKVKLKLLQDPSEPLREVFTGATNDSKDFLKNILNYNSAFKMTSFGAKIIHEEGFMPTYKVQMQVYHCIGSLLPLPNEEPQFLQLYFVSDLVQQAQKRVDATRVTKIDRTRSCKICFMKGTVI